MRQPARAESSPLGGASPHTCRCDPTAAIVAEILDAIQVQVAPVPQSEEDEGQQAAVRNH